MGLKIAEGVFTVAIVALVLTNARGFQNALQAAGTGYSSIVRGLRSGTLARPAGR